eukprot:gene20056-24053_t
MTEYPQQLVHLALRSSARKEIGQLPASLKHFIYESNKQIQPQILPMGLTHLTLGSGFRLPILQYSLPRHLTHLDLGLSFDVASGLLPPTLVYLKVGDLFNQDIVEGRFSGCIALRHLILGYEFDRRILPGGLPETLEELELGFRYNRPLGQALSTLKSLRYLSFGGMYDHQIQSQELPASLGYLKFGSQFNRPIRPYTLPPKLKTLVFGFNFNQPLYNCCPSIIPESVTRLSLGRYFDKHLDNLPLALVHLTADIRFKVPASLPTSLTNVILSLGINIDNNIIPFFGTIQQLLLANIAVELDTNDQSQSIHLRSVGTDW